MTYIQGFVVPEKPGQKNAYRDMAAKALTVFRRIRRDAHGGM